MRRILPSALACLLAAAQSLAAAGAPGHEPFPEPPAMRHQIDFWQRVYVEIDTSAGFLHDGRRLDVVYETLEVGSPGASRRAQKRVNARKRHWRRILERLASGAPARSADARRATSLWEAALGRTPTARELRAAARGLRFQRGQRDKFERGLVRAGALEGEIRRILRAHGVPEDLAYLPHVESSFNARAYSKYGAAGMWQFMRSTGKRYLVIDQAVDERLAPMVATRAAAQLLRDNHAQLGSWPLAITAYNHGAAGMKRARAKLGTDDIGTIVERYRGRTFGFASRNFYAQFLAARRLARDPEPHFGPLVRKRPEPVERVRLDFYADIRDLERHLGVPRDRLRALNPALRPAVFRSDKYVPREFELRLPPATVEGGASARLASLPGELRHRAQRRSLYHVVRRGETLGQIARRNGTTVASLVALNDLRSRHRIRAGQKLELVASRSPARSVSRRTPPPAERAEKSAPPAPTVAAAAAPAKVIKVSAKRAPSTGLIDASLAAGAHQPHWRRLDGDWTVVDHDETIGHFADWLRVSSTRLRQINGLSKRKRLRMGQRLKLDFTRVGRDEFLVRRAAHHAEIEARFFSRHALVGTKVHTVRAGENLWHLSNNVYRVPTWLLHRHNPESVLRRLSPGTPINIPVLEPST
jgi:membrane-bound lytic murein transglycosylase D